MVTLYYGKNRRGEWKASLDFEKVSKFQELRECEVETIHGNRVYMIRTYRGFDYSWGITSSIVDVVSVSKLFHSVHAAKKAEVWTKAASVAKANPDDFHVDAFSIASDDGGAPFITGDVMEDKFNMTIIPVRVI